MDKDSFANLAATSAFWAAVSGLIYSVAFVVITRFNAPLGNLLSSLFLMLGGIFAVIVLTALYERLRAISQPLALVALLFGLVASMGAAIHGAYDLANVIHHPGLALADLPSGIDPRGFLTFGVAGLAVLINAWLMSLDKLFPRNLVRVGLALAVLLVVVYFGRLIILDPTHLAVVVPAAIVGFIVNPLWYFWLSTILRKT